MALRLSVNQLPAILVCATAGTEETAKTAKQYIAKCEKTFINLSNVVGSRMQIAPSLKIIPALDPDFCIAAERSGAR